MTWTATKPTTGGFFWYRRKPQEQHYPLHLKLEAGIVKTQTGVLVEKMGGEWSEQPIPQPK